MPEELKFRVRAIVPIIDDGGRRGTATVVPKGMTGECHGATREADGLRLIVYWDYVASFDPALDGNTGKVVPGWEMLDVDPAKIEVA